VYGLRGKLLLFWFRHIDLLQIRLIFASGENGELVAG
jgi:hypothetical protein